MARPIIVTGVTTESGAAFGPFQVHGGGPYSRMAGAVKAMLAQTRRAGFQTRRERTRAGSAATLLATADTVIE
jgi:hypothetical protein